MRTALLVYRLSPSSPFFLHLDCSFSFTQQYACSTIPRAKHSAFRADSSISRMSSGVLDPGPEHSDTLTMGRALWATHLLRCRGCPGQDILLEATLLLSFSGWLLANFPFCLFLFFPKVTFTDRFDVCYEL